MPAKITKKMKKAYIDNGGSQCPYCGSTALRVGELEDQGHFMTRAIDCSICHEKWRECYGLEDVYVEE